MPNKPVLLAPEPSGRDRAAQSVEVRVRAAALACTAPEQGSNEEVRAYAPECPTTFTKGLPHDEFGIAVDDARDRFVAYLNQANRSGFGHSDDGSRLVLGPEHAPCAVRPDDGYEEGDALGHFVHADHRMAAVRRWESPLAGHVFDLEGPDADALAMPPAPRLGSGELAAELAEVYALALLRDVPFADIASASGTTPQGESVAEVLASLSRQPWFSAPDADCRADKRRRARLDKHGKVSPTVAFRGSTHGARRGPYLSQFLLIGNASRAGAQPSSAAARPSGAFRLRAFLGPATGEAIKGEGADPGELRRRRTSDGYILYGVQEIDQRLQPHKAGVDHLTDWAHWIDVQNGADAKGDVYEDRRRFITTPRDLATYVHFDALYQAYLNACLLLLGYEHPFDRGLPERDDPVRKGFATFGGPHILTLVTEVATRALKAVRRQKYNIHLRARPEALGGMVSLAASTSAGELGPAEADATKLLQTLHRSRSTPQAKDGLLDLISARNARSGVSPAPDGAPGSWLGVANNYLLPMAFPEGSPMHPSYGAGHATVAGACVTILKAFFEMFEGDGWSELPFQTIYGSPGEDSTPIYQPSADGLTLEPVAAVVTLQGELDKLAANIAIGRDMAGVHYYTDYYESLRLGERIAVGLLREQMLTYPENVTMRLLTFDHERMTIEGHGDGRTVTVSVVGTTFDAWFARQD